MYVETKKSYDSLHNFVHSVLSDALEALEIFVPRRREHYYGMVALLQKIANFCFKREEGREERGWGDNVWGRKSWWPLSIPWPHLWSWEPPPSQPPHPSTVEVTNSENLSWASIFGPLLWNVEEEDSYNEDKKGSLGLT